MSILKDKFWDILWDYKADIKSNEEDTHKSAEDCEELVKEIAINYADFRIKQELEWFWGYGINTIYKKANGKQITEKELFEEFKQTL